ncbi:MAG TPA: hypothetical protein VMH00_04610 [Candidatus Limnocylindrales bacterium]|nr:hypothetical protein [Candidatus Limnocylindrales bacterium]
MKHGIEITIIWMDQDVLEIAFRCSNECFSGQAEMYLGHDTLSEMAEALGGFPANSKDSREFQLGAFEPNHAGGGAWMHFRCVDSAGHAVVEVKVRSEGVGDIEYVALRIPILAADVESFLSQVRQMNKQVGATAHLQAAKS